MIFFKDREAPVSLSSFFISIVILTISLFLFHYFKGQPSSPDSYQRLANLKSIVEEGKARTYKEPLPSAMLLIWRKISFSTYTRAYQIFIYLSFSLFLHLLMLNFKKDLWKLNHYFIVYLTAFLPFSISLPYEYLEEILCFSFILILNYNFEIETMGDLFKLIFYSFLALLCNILAFFALYSLFVLIHTLNFMQKEKTRTTVFYKKKNIPRRALLTYILMLVIVIAWMGTSKYFGPGSFHIIYEGMLSTIYHFFPIIVVIRISEYLLRKEKELNTKGTTFIVSILIIVSGYYLYKADYENIDYLERQKTEILSLRAKGKILNGQNLYGYQLLSDFVYYHTGEKILFADIAKITPNDYLIVRGLDINDKFLQEKNRSFYKTLVFPLDENTIVIGKDLIDAVLGSEKDSLAKKKILENIHSFPRTTTYERVNRFFSHIFFF